jgi:hypothetical protein
MGRPISAWKRWRHSRHKGNSFQQVWRLNMENQQMCSFYCATSKNIVKDQQSCDFGCTRTSTSASQGIQDVVHLTLKTSKFQEVQWQQNGQPISTVQWVCSLDSLSRWAKTCQVSRYAKCTKRHSTKSHRASNRMLCLVASYIKAITSNFVA